MANNKDNKVFEMMTSVADKTNVDILNHPKDKKVTSKEVHTALMAAGMTPAYGNIADLVDATLYALEGEFGEAALSSVAAIPVIGQMVSGRKALKAAKEAGEEIVTLYRGNAEWVRGGMVKNKRYVGPDVVSGHVQGIKHKTASSGSLFTSTDPVYAMTRTKASSWKMLNEKRLKYSMKTGEYFDKRGFRRYRDGDPRWNKKEFDEYISDQKNKIKHFDETWKSIVKKDIKRGKLNHVLEFEVPKKWIDKYGKTPEGAYDGTFMFEEGLPTGFLKTVHKGAS